MKLWALVWMNLARTFTIRAGGRLGWCVKTCGEDISVPDRTGVIRAHKRKAACIDDDNGFMGGFCVITSSFPGWGRKLRGDVGK